MPGADRWASGDAYEPYVGRWSRLVARRFIERLAPAPELRWLDVGCGTGALTATILELASPASVLGIDPSAEFVSFARERITDPRASFDLGDAEQVPGGPARFDTAVSGLVLNFVPDPAASLREMKRVTTPGGWIAAYVWDYAEGMEMMRAFWDAATEIDASATALDEAVRFPLCRPEPLRAFWEQAGLRDVTVEDIEVPTVFRDFLDFWTPFLGGQGPAPTYLASLTEADRGAIGGLLRQRLAEGEDGPIHLRARAWAVLGRS